MVFSPKMNLEQLKISQKMTESTTKTKESWESSVCATPSLHTPLVVKKSRDGKYVRKWQMVNGPALDVEFHSLMCLSQA